MECGERGNASLGLGLMEIAERGFLGLEELEFIPPKREHFENF